MAHPSAFDGENGVLGPPPGVSEDDCSSLSIKREVIDDNIVLTHSCWKLTQEELDEINRTGRVWLTIWGAHPPVCISGIRPFKVD